MFSVRVSHGCERQSWLSCRFAISYSFTRSHLHDSLYMSTSFSQGIFTGEFLKCSCVYSQKKNPLIINTESVYLSPSDSLTCGHLVYSRQFPVFDCITGLTDSVDYNRCFVEANGFTSRFRTTIGHTGFLTLLPELLVGGGGHTLVGRLSGL
jgi:hypothetical protein